MQTLHPIAAVQHGGGEAALDAECEGRRATRLRFSFPPQHKALVRPGAVFLEGYALDVLTETACKGVGTAVGLHKRHQR
jgi:hypothetical protein